MWLEPAYSKLDVGLPAKPQIPVIYRTDLFRGKMTFLSRCLTPTLKNERSVFVASCSVFKSLDVERTNGCFLPPFLQDVSAVGRDGRGLGPLSAVGWWPTAQWKVMTRSPCQAPPRRRSP